MPLQNMAECLDLCFLSPVTCVLPFPSEPNVTAVTHKPANDDAAAQDEADQLPVPSFVSLPTGYHTTQGNIPAWRSQKEGLVHGAASATRSVALPWRTPPAAGRPHSQEGRLIRGAAV